MRLLLLIAGTLISICRLWAGDSLVRFSHLTFGTDAARSEFLAVARNEPNDCVGLLFSPYGQTPTLSTAQVRAQIEAFVQNIEPVVSRKSAVKQVKYIYRAVHDRFFRQYSLRNSFCDIFTDGRYNCVSGTALYAIVFGRLGIPYRILETPRHVFLIAYPETHKVVVESTDPQHGYGQFSESFVEKYLTALVNAKLLTAADLAANPHEALFQKYFFSSSPLSLRELAGIQFANFGLYLAEEHRYAEAVTEFKKACYLHPAVRQQFLLKEALAALLNSSDYSRADGLNNLLLLCSYRNQENSDVNDQTVYHEYARVLEHLFTTGKGFETYETFYQQVLKTVSDTVLSNKITYTHNYEMARAKLFNLKSGTGVFEHLESAYRVNPTSLYLHGLIIAAFEHEASRVNDVGQLDALITRYRIPFSFLDTNLLFNERRGSTILDKAYQQFMLNNTRKGLGYLREFEDACAAIPNFGAYPAAVERAYTAAAVYHFKRGQKSAARAFLEKGLRYAPGNFSLMHRLNAIRN